MHSATSQLQQHFAKPAFWQGQLPSAPVPSSAPFSSSATLSTPVPSSASTPFSASVPPSASTPSSALSSALHAPGTVLPFPHSLIGTSPFYKALPTSSSSPPMPLPAFYQQNVSASQLNVPSVVGQPNSSVSASLVHPPPVFAAPSTANSLHTSNSAAVRFPFSTCVGPMMSHFEMIGTDNQMFPQNVRLNPGLALCSSAPFGGHIGTSLPSAVTVSPAAVASVGGGELQQFAIPRISQQSQAQPVQGLQFALGQSVIFGGESARDGGGQQTQHLFDLSNSIICTNGSSMANASVISMAAAISKGSLLSQCQSQQRTKQNCASRQRTYALSDSPVPSPLKQPAEAADTVKIPKETITVPLERSCASASSVGSAGEHRSHQINCQVSGFRSLPFLLPFKYYKLLVLPFGQFPSFLVCYLAASNGLHFGARTCAACAAFFRRSISDQKRYICKRSQRCVIRAMETQGYRKMCRNCRMKRCLEIGMLPENVQNKRNKRDFYFADALSNAISQQQRQQQNERTTQANGAGTEGEAAESPRGERRQRTECRGPTPAATARTDFGINVFGEAQRQNGNELQQKTASGDQTKAENGTAPWDITLREM
ncbi:hypothetical protein niasHS_002452 [Heterodera schachtii]|uniref:Nuclear receptor domain-containing protein n=1 Tax=Heterodera schachtii TaxID=97005 RepID=A0ABD2KK16_HETSC